jgi:LPXTG-site transpeptidase (sortase) family protein
MEHLPTMHGPPYHDPPPAGGPGRSAAAARARVIVGLVLFAAGLLVVVFVGRPATVDRTGEATGRSAAAIEPLPTTTTTTLPRLPLPDALPANPYEPTPDEVVGTIEIPKIGLAEDLHTGMTLTAIDRGPSWWPGTARPGELGNVVVAGHRTTRTRPFYKLNELTAGDEVIFTTAAGRFVYEVRGLVYVPADWIDVAAQSYAHTATLFACHPPGSAAERIVVKLRLLDGQGRGVDPESALPPLDAETQRTEHTLLVRPRPGEPLDGPASGADPLSASNG